MRAVPGVLRAIGRELIATRQAPATRPHWQRFMDAPSRPKRRFAALRRCARSTRVDSRPKCILNTHSGGRGAAERRRDKAAEEAALMELISNLALGFSV